MLQNESLCYYHLDPLVPESLEEQNAKPQCKSRTVFKENEVKIQHFKNTVCFEMAEQSGTLVGFFVFRRS